MGSEPYNSLLRDRYADIKPMDARTFYTISCGKGIIKPHTPPTGVIFSDSSFLRIFEKWAVRDNNLLVYSYHYQIPHGISIRMTRTQSASRQIIQSITYKQVDSGKGSGCLPGRSGARKSCN